MTDWTRIESTGQTCRICEKGDWCLYSETAVICGRIESCNLPTCHHCRSGKPKRAGDGGWLHLTSRQRCRLSAKTTRHRIPDCAWFERLHAEFRADIQPAQFDWWSRELGVTAEALDRLEMGWSGDGPFGVTFPVRNVAGHVCGISVRSMQGRKTCIRGSALGSGLFVPTGLHSVDEVFVTEGASDTAALLSVGLPAVGRPSISIDAELVRRYVTHAGFRRVVVVGDNDTHGAGQRAAQRLANYLRHFVHCGLLIPPVKDVRQWVIQGADRSVIMEGVRNVD